MLTYLTLVIAPPTRTQRMWNALRRGWRRLLSYKAKFRA